uniref:Uncharacterized protein n=1 Tax=Ralstonia solanacearum TaxID=305 RepID=A0A0S4WWA0_RALSL|nr:protein of unknown function [Ralstonia solanacearum]CUV55886.1 protein of unknown function [Ralstonia solanacearum]
MNHLRSLAEHMSKKAYQTARRAQFYLMMLCGMRINCLARRHIRSCCASARSASRNRASNSTTPAETTIAGPLRGPRHARFHW